MKVDLFYNSPNTYGGWVTYTSHLIDTLQAVGAEVSLFKIRPRSEKRTRNFGYDKRYRNISMEEALARSNVKLIVAGAKNFKKTTDTLYHDGNAFIVVHDPTELKNLPEPLDMNRCVVIRQRGVETLPLANNSILLPYRPTFIRHPYVQKELPFASRKHLAISTSRIDFDKHTEILLDANRLLPENKKIVIRGFENRLYTKFKIVPKYPEWVQSKAHYPRENDYAFNLMCDYIFNVDMTLIKGDGGGTQYTWLEAWNAGCIPIIHREWLLDTPDDMRENYNCIVIETAKQLAEVLQMPMSDTVLQDFRQNGFDSLKQHEPEIIGEQYLTFFRSLG
tara:strand:- start:10145 stop:11149 length:1005 start_codon:yes stop_codon:yes gene_type:complete